jgi:peptidoglycan/LPS O-acetylase OafA/YrhL
VKAAPPPSPAEPQHFAFVDALRGIACLLVFVYHVGLHYVHGVGGHFAPRVWDLIDSGARGVQLFYVISAFTLFHSFGQRQQLDSRPVSFFLLRRFFRIAPLFYFMIAAYALRDYLQLGVMPRPADILVHLALLHGLVPSLINTAVPGGWSVGIEMLFYLLIPFLFARIKSLRQAIWFVLASVVFARVAHAFAVHALHLASQETEYYLFFWLPNQLPVFAFGFVLFFWDRQVRGRAPAGDVETRRNGTLLLAIAAFSNAALLTGPGYKILNTYVLYSAVYAVVGVGLGCNPISPLVNRATRFFGKISYGFYLIHPAAIDLVSKNILRGRSSFAVGFCGTLVGALFLTAALAWLTFRFVETPGQAVGKRIIQRLRLRDAEARQLVPALSDTKA